MTTQALRSRLSGWVFEAAPPATRIDTMDEEHSLDAARLSFPAHLVITIVATVVAVAGSVWVAQAGLKSDVRDIMTRMEAQRDLEAERSAAVREALDALKRRQELQQYELQGMKETIMKLQNGGTR